MLTNCLGRLWLLPLMACLATPASSEEGSSDAQEWAIRFENGIRFERNDGAHKIQIGGRTYLDFASVTASPAVQNNLAPFDTNGTGVEVRSARIYLLGQLFNHVEFKSEIDFATGDVQLKDAFVGLKGVPVVGRIRIGHQKEPFGLEQITSTRYMSFMERSAADVLTPSRNVGIAISNTFLDKRMRWSLGGFADSKDGKLSFGDPGTYNLTGRLTGSPVYRDEGKTVVHLGISYSHRFHSPSRYKAGPEAHLAEAFVDTGLLDLAGTDLLALETALVCGPFSLQAEPILAWVDPSQESERALLWGAYVEASYFLTGESRNYNYKSGVFVRTKPKQNFQLGGSGWGAVQIAARFSHLDLNDASVRGGSMQNYALGVNWLLFPNARFMANYIHSDLNDGGGHANIFQLRTQFDF